MLLSIAAVCALAMASCSDDAETLPKGAPGGAGGSGGTGGAGGGGAEPPTEMVATVVAYNYNFDIDSLAATSQVTVDVTGAGNCLTLPCNVAVTDPLHDGNPATVTFADGFVLTTCAEWVDAGSQLVLETQQVVPEQTQAPLDVGFSRKQNLAGGTFSYLVSWVGGCDRFGPCDDDPALFADYRFEVTHSPGATVLCPGTLTPGSTLTTCEISSVPSYSTFGIASDPMWTRSVFTNAAGIEVVFYEVPGGPLQSSLDSNQVDAFLVWITNLLGAYPYGSELRVWGGPTAWGGFEHPGSISLRENLMVGAMGVFTHEVVHMWAGNRTTLATAEDFAWKEAIANYLSYVFEDEQGVPGEADATRQFWDGYALQARYWPRPNDEPKPELRLFYSDVYGAGPMVMFIQLETIFGRAVILQAIVDFLSPHSARSVADLQASLEAASGEDLGPYFDAWVFGTGIPDWPVLSASSMQAGNQVTVTLTQQGNAPKGCIVEVDVYGLTTSATATIDFGLAPTSNTAQAVVTLAEPVVSLAIDPRGHVVNRVMNVADPPKMKHPWLP